MLKQSAAATPRGLDRLDSELLSQVSRSRPSARQRGVVNNVESSEAQPHRQRRSLARTGALLWVALSVVVGAAVALSVAVNGQSDLRARADAMAGTPAIRAFLASRMAKGFTPPKTPWGDPEISGMFDTSPEANTPMERPDEWAGRKMDDITPSELAEAIAKRQQDALEFAPFFGGGEPEVGVAIAVPIHWFDNLTAVNARPWWVIEPADGKIPPLTPEVAERRKAAAANQAKERSVPGFRPGGRRDHYSQRSASERCITFQGPWRTPIIYGNAHH